MDAKEIANKINNLAQKIIQGGDYHTLSGEIKNLWDFANEKGPTFYHEVDRILQDTAERQMAEAMELAGIPKE